MPPLDEIGLKNNVRPSAIKKHFKYLNISIFRAFRAFTLIIFSICRKKKLEGDICTCLQFSDLEKKNFYRLPYWNHFFPQSLETKSGTIYTWLESWDYRLSEKNVFGFSPVENFKIFLTPNFTFQLPFKQAYFHLDRKRGSPIASKSLLRKF